MTEIVIDTFTPQELLLGRYLHETHCIEGGEARKIIAMLAEHGYVIVPKTATSAMPQAGNRL